MAQVNSTDEAINGINVTPLVDIVLVLLVVFMVTAKLIAGNSIPLDLPKAATAGATQTMLSVSLDAAGVLRVDGQTVGADTELEHKARAALSSNPELRTLVAASSGVSHGAVMHVVDTLRKVGIVRIAFAADVPPQRD